MKLFLAVLLLASSALAQPKPAGDCNRPAPEPITFVSLPGHPFGTVATKDGCWLFVTLTSANPKSANGVAMLKRSGGSITLQKVFPVEAGPTGAVLTHDNKLLILADDEYVTFMDVDAMISGKRDPIAGFLRDGRFSGSVYANVTADDKFLFVSDENAATITVINLQKARNEGFKESAIVGKIPVGEAPIALTFSPDGKLLYTTSELAPKEWNWPAECKPEGQDPATAKIEYPAGAIIVVDVAKAEADPAHSVIAKVPAGCSPVRMAISPNGDTVYITARNSNAVLAFNAAKLVSDSNNALIGKVPVGSAPVPIAVADNGTKILAGNSNRFAAGENDKQHVTVIDASKVSSGEAAVMGSLPAQGFPREFGYSPDGRTLFLANYSSNSLEIIDVARMQITPKM